MEENKKSKKTKIIAGIIAVFVIIGVIGASTSQSTEKLSQKYGDVINGSKTEKIGEYAYVFANKSEFIGMSTADFINFVNLEVASAEKLKKNWFVVDFEDGTGLFFTGCNTEIVSYVELTPDKSMKKEIRAERITETLSLKELIQ